MIYLHQFFSFFLFIVHMSIGLPTHKDDNITGNAVLDNFPLIDGHNDLPNNLYERLANKLQNYDFEQNFASNPLLQNCTTCFTDIQLLKQGKVGAQFWVAYVDCLKTESNMMVVRTLEQIDVIHRLIAKYPQHLQFVSNSSGLLDAFGKKKVASLIGVEGGHSIGNNLAVLRQFYQLGVRYLTLTHICNLPWADSSLVDKEGSKPVRNLTDFGKKVVREMNRLGMMVDLSHVSHNVMVDAIQTSKAPVIFSHSSAFEVYAHHRNVKDDVLKMIKSNGGIVMVNFYSSFVAKANATILDVIGHISHIADVAGVESLGIGGDYDGVDSMPVGLENVSKYPQLFDLLKKHDPQRWTADNLEKLAGRNFYRVFQQVEKVRDDLAHVLADESCLNN